MADGKDSKYSVGYGKPPQHTQFKKGRSGNPKGRPRHKMSFEDTLHTELSALISVQENGRSRRIPRLRALVKRAVAEALAGNIRYVELLVQILQRSQPERDGTIRQLVEEFRERNNFLRAGQAVDDVSSDRINGNQSDGPREES